MQNHPTHHCHAVSSHSRSLRLMYELIPKLLEHRVLTTRQTIYCFQIIYIESIPDIRHTLRMERKYK